MGLVSQVFILKPGSILRDDLGNILDARSSVTLILAGSMKIVVDTGQKGEEEKIRKGLARLDLEPYDIDCIINTHSHFDHIGNNHLFTKAKTIFPNEREIIASGVWSINTPGHSMDSISIVIECYAKTHKNDLTNEGKFLVIAGDALPTFGNFQKNVPPSIHVDRDLAISSMAKIIALADIVVPGHDLPFCVKKNRCISNNAGLDLTKIYEIEGNTISK